MRLIVINNNRKPENARMNRMNRGIFALVASAGLLVAVSAGADTWAPLPPVPEPPENPITEPKRILGKILFWDEQLSSTNTMACGTCHIPSTGGTDPRHGVHPGADGLFGTADDVIGSKGVVALSSPTTPVAHPLFGFDVQVTDRATPTFIGAMFSTDLFHDGRARSRFVDPETGDTVVAAGGALESQAVGPIMSTVEMAHQGRSWDEVRAKLQAVTPLALATTNVPADIRAALASYPSYPTLFAAAFGDTAINASRIAKALATYQRTLLPDQTPWDRYIAGDTNAMTTQQLAGWNYLKDTADGALCMECHKPPMFTDHQFYNIGLRPSEEDLGRQNVTGDPLDRGRFKTPTWRNVGLRKHMGHVGWLTDTWDVIDFYNKMSSPDETSRHVQFTADQSTLPESGLPYETAQILPSDEGIQDDVAVFLNEGLTDPRVAAETFPFDRPTLRSEFGPAAAGAQIKLLTWNIASTAWSADKADRIAAILRVEAPHVIGLQETDAAAMADLEARLNADYVVIDPVGTDNPNPILVRRNAFNVLASGGTDENAMLYCGGKSYVNFAVLQPLGQAARLSIHNTRLCDLGTAPSGLEGGNTALQSNQSHAADLVERVGQTLAAHGSITFIAADFNVGVNHATMNFLLDQTPLPGSVANPLVLDDTYQAANGTARAGDHGILYKPGLVTVHAAQVVNNPSTRAASGHSPVVSLIEIHDADGDGVHDASDNCTLVANANQRDTDGDGYGNLCDADLNNNGIVNTLDLGLFKRVFGQTGAGLHADFNGDNRVNTLDLGILKSRFGKAPGPSGLVP